MFGGAIECKIFYLGLWVLLFICLFYFYFSVIFQVHLKTVNLTFLKILQRKLTFKKINKLTKKNVPILPKIVNWLNMFLDEIWPGHFITNLELKKKKQTYICDIETIRI